MEAVASQPPVAPGAAADVTPVAGWASMPALPSAMRELARFFMNLSGSSSLGATGDIAGVTASAVASGGLACPSSTAAAAATFCAAAATPAGAGVSPDAPAAVPGVSGEQQRRVRSRSRGRCSWSSSERTDRRAKKRTRRRSPSPGRSSRRREKRYRSSSDSSEDDRADTSPPQARRAHGGARACGSTWDFDCPRSSARVEPDWSGARRRSPGPSGAAEDDRSSTFESVDFARDDSFRAVLGLIREFHDMAEPAMVPAARCKTSLASAYGLASDSSPAFTLPVSPLLSTLLIDINSDLSKFLENQTVHGFLPVPGRRQRRYYGTSTSSFPGPYTVPPGMTSITMEKASEVRKRSVSLSASQVSSMETMLSGMCEVASWWDWWLSTCGCERNSICERNSSHNKVREFIYSPVGHVVTGNLGIVDKLGNLDQLKRVLQLRYKYRVQSFNVTWGRIKRDLMVTVESLKNKIIDKNNGNADDLNDWERILKRRVNNRIRAMQNSHTLEHFKYGIDISLLDKQIDIINKHFVITTVDKASKNFAFICKKFYISKIKEELGIREGRIEGNDVYAYCRGSSPQEIVYNQCMQLERLHDKVSDSNKRIPKLFMIPKFHKRPYKYRFIAGASNATTKRLAIDVNVCLKLIKKIHKGYCKSIYNRNGYTVIIFGVWITLKKS